VPEFDRYAVQIDDEKQGCICTQWPEGLHCGAGLTVWAYGEWRDVGLEYGKDGWYLTRTPYRGDLQNVPVRLEGSPYIV